MGGRSPTFVGVSAEGDVDPAAAVVRDGRVLACSEEERHVRYKHAPGFYPIRALTYCLETAEIDLEDVAAVAVNWNLPAYSDGTMRTFFQGVRDSWDVDPQTIAWQDGLMSSYTPEAAQAYHERNWRRAFGDGKFPRLYSLPHHFTHAFHAAMQSPFERAVCLSIDGSGDEHTAVLWRKEGTELEPIRELRIPHSLGWVYAAFTEYLGFEAYDGEYKVMGLAAYGRPDEELTEKIDRIVRPAADGVGFVVDPHYVHYGAHSYSGRFTDDLPALLGRPPRRPEDEVTEWHQDLAYAVQDSLERTVERLIEWAVETTGIRNVCVGGGVGLNVKMNSRLFRHPAVDDLFVQPLCSDSGSVVGAALAACYQLTGVPPEPLTTLALGHEETNESIERTLVQARIDYERPSDICDAVADELARGRLVAWFQGRMEAGPRALGQRSILADPRDTVVRDKVNAIVKYRESWRPFCPSMLAEAAPRYFDQYTDAPFMIIAFAANDALKADAPAIVHFDGSSRVQLVHERVLPRYHRLIRAFERRTGVPVVLNTSFNVKGEPIVCTIQDALRTFWSTGLEVLAAADFLVRKPRLDTT